MAEKEQPKHPTHRAYAVIRREGQDDFWLNLGLVFPHKDNGGFNIMLQALPLDGKIVCREITDSDEAQAPARDNSRTRDDELRRDRPSRQPARRYAATRRFGHNIYLPQRSLREVFFCFAAPSAGSSGSPRQLHSLAILSLF